MEVEGEKGNYGGMRAKQIREKRKNKIMDNKEAKDGDGDNDCIRVSPDQNPDYATVLNKLFVDFVAPPYS